MPTNVAARMTLAADPGSLQGAVAAGILGCGPVLLGTSEACARLLEAAQERGRPRRRAGRGRPQAAPRPCARRARSCRASAIPCTSRSIPRAERILELADARGVSGPHVALARCFRDAAAEAWGRPLTMNVSMPIAAVMLDLGFPATVVKAVPILARTAGLLAHLAEERELPAGFAMAKAAEDAIEYRAPVTADDAAYREQLAYLLERSAFYREKLGFTTREEAGGLADIAALPLTEKQELRATVTPREPDRRAPVRRPVRAGADLLDERHDRHAELHPADRRGRRELADGLDAHVRRLGHRRRRADRHHLQRRAVRGRRGARRVRAPRASATSRSAPGTPSGCCAPSSCSSRRRSRSRPRTPRTRSRRPPSAASTSRARACGACWWRASRAAASRRSGPGSSEGWGARVTEAMGVGDIGVSLFGECEAQDGMHLQRAGLRPPGADRPGDRRRARRSRTAPRASSCSPTCATALRRSCASAPATTCTSRAEPVPRAGARARGSAASAGPTTC